MSYDLYMIREPEDGNLENAIHVQLEREEEGEIGPLDRAKENWKAALAHELQRLDSSLTPFQFDYAVIAKELNLSEQDARIRWRHVELNGPDNGPGIQITINDDSVTLTVPYWHCGDKASVVFSKIREYVEVLVECGKLIVYDPQLEQVINLAHDMPDVLACYTSTVDRMPEIAANAIDESHAKPWWKFW